MAQNWPVFNQIHSRRKFRFALGKEQKFKIKDEFSVKKYQLMIRKMLDGVSVPSQN